jgi:hypothetical protein
LEIIVYRDLHRRIEKAEKLLDRLAPTVPLDPEQARKRRFLLRSRNRATPEERAELAELNERFAEEDRIRERWVTLVLRKLHRKHPLSDEERQELAELENKFEAIKRAEGPL